MISIIKKSIRWYTRNKIYYLLILFITCLLSFLGIILQIAINPSTYNVTIGSIAPLDIHAPTSITFTSQTLTEKSKNIAEEKVQPVYLPIDPAIARNQINRLRTIFRFINTVRTDPFSTQEQKLLDLNAISDFKISNKIAERVLNLDSSNWDIIQQETQNALEETMRLTIHPDQIDEARQNVPTIISFNIPEDLGIVISDIVTQFIVPNSLFSPEQTLTNKQKARDSVTPISRSYLAGETIVSQGQIITPEIYEALSQLGMIKTTPDIQSIISTASIIVLMAGFVSLFFVRFKLQHVFNLKSIIIISFTFLAFLLGARYAIPNRTIIPYLFPLPAFGLTIASLYNVEFGLISSLSLSVLAAYGLQNSLDLTLFYGFTSLCSILAMSKGQRVANFIWSGVVIGTAGSTIILAYRLPGSVTDWQGIATLIGVSYLNGIASAGITLIFQFLFSQLLGLTTALQLMDLSRPDHPLLQFILRNAPGTYQHSLQVANLAEQAAEKIGADSLLVRVGALYHDAGKALNPSFFIENQIPGKINPHNDINPAQSASIIIRHVSDGLSLAKKYRLPPRIKDFINEHHGTLLTRYQYSMAIKSAEDDPSKVDERAYRYPGPAPSSREAALLMLSDGCEARARAEIPKNENELRTLVKKVFDYCHHEGQLDNTSLSLRDLNETMESFINSLQNLYHPRLQYPEFNIPSGVNTRSLSDK